MAKNQRMQKPVKAGEVLNPQRLAKSQIIAARGVNTTHDIANLMRSLISDLGTDSVAPQKANAICNAAKTMLKTAEVQFKWKTSDGGEGKSLRLTSGD